ncbi:hypothetical protein CgunFtcFv8_018428 [Champsocephalus gunnari]|nr:hypothetical protein CgunFtcFv8_018428 [Champsocephalus gunnari]
MMRDKRSTVDQQAASINSNGPVYGSLRNQATDSCGFRDTRGRGASLRLGRRDGEAPIVPSLDRVRHPETLLQGSWSSGSGG